MRENTGASATFETLTQEEKRHVITMLSMGKLSEDEKRQLAQICAQSVLSEEEKQQLNRAFSMSRLSDEERRQLLAKRKIQKENEQREAAVSGDASAAEKQMAACVRIPSSKVSDEHARTVIQPMVSASQTAGRSDEDDNAVTRHTEKVSAKKKEKPLPAETDDEDDYEPDHTALTSLLKGIVYIVAVLVISVFASWTIIEVGNDVFAFVKSDEIVTVTIREEMTSSDVAQMLAENGIIKYPTMYELYVRLKKESTEYRIGEYEVSPSMNYGKLNDAFTYVSKTSEQVVVTIPEGYTTDQIIDLMLSYGIGTKEGFEAAINTYEYSGFRFIDELSEEMDPERKYRLDGYLFPDTYFFFKDSSEVAVIYKLLQNFDKKVSEEYYERAALIGMSLDDMIILSSMVQAEGRSLTDFENISSVFHNRLNNPGRFPLLQSDATLQYILEKRKTALTVEDLQIDSKYNSYMYPGLPPGAICNAGMSAIDCAFYPAQTDYYYFLSDGKGNTYFSRTNEEHEALKKEYIDNQ